MTSKQDFQNGMLDIQCLTGANNPKGDGAFPDGKYGRFFRMSDMRRQRTASNDM